MTKRTRTGVRMTGAALLAMAALTAQGLTPAATPATAEAAVMAPSGVAKATAAAPASAPTSVVQSPAFMPGRLGRVYGRRWEPVWIATEKRRGRPGRSSFSYHR